MRWPILARRTSITEAVGRPPTRSFELYVEGARWLIVIAAGVLAFGFDALKDHVGRLSFYVYCLTAGLLAVAVAFGLAYLWYSYAYASQREGKPRGDPDVRRAKARSDRAFNLLLWTFGAGMVSFAVFSGMLMLELRLASPTLTLTPVSSADAPSVIAQRDGRLWLLERTAQGLRWTELPPPAAPASAPDHPKAK
jgi:hypothetical protein